MLVLGLDKFVEDLTEISGRAAKEFSLEKVSVVFAASAVASILHGYAFHCTRPTGQRPNDISRLNRANRGEFILLFSVLFPNPPHKWNILKISSPTNRSVKMHWEFSSGLTDPTGQSGPPQAVVTNIPFRTNWKGYFHFHFDPTVRNVWYNGKQAGCFLRKTGNNLTELLVT